MNIKPTPEQIKQWYLHATSDKIEGPELAVITTRMCELAAAWGAAQAQPDPREMYQMLQCMQAGEMTVSRGIELLEMWQAGNYTHDDLPPCGECLPDDKMPWDVIKELREQLAQAQQTTCEYCDGTGDVHSRTGEWRGTCTCEAAQAQQTTVEEPELPEAVGRLLMGARQDFITTKEAGTLEGGTWHNLYTAAHLHAFADAKVRAAGSQDAKRYRWLRDKARSVDWSRNFNGFFAYQPNCRSSADQMDRDIDAAIMLEEII